MRHTEAARLFEDDREVQCDAALIPNSSMSSKPSIHCQDFDLSLLLLLELVKEGGLKHLLVRSGYGRR